MNENQEQHINVEQTDDQIQDIPLNTTETEPKKKTIPTRFGSLIILLTATIAGAGVWWYSFSYEEPQVIDVSQLVIQLQERRVIADNTNQREVPSEYEVKNDGIYYQDKLIVGIDPETFAYIGYSSMDPYDGYGYAKDKNNVYRYGFPIGEEFSVMIIKDVDPQTFEMFVNGYTKDEGHVYIDGIAIEGADASTFETIDGETIAGGYAKDINAVYYHGKRIEQAVPDTFKIITSDTYAPYEGSTPLSKDQNHIFFMEKILIEADPDTYEILYDNPGRRLSYYYSRDVEHVFINNVILLDADPETFEIVNSQYMKDKNRVYQFYFGEVVEGVDPANCTVENLDGCKEVE